LTSFREEKNEDLVGLVWLVSLDAAGFAEEQETGPAIVLTGLEEDLS
jgi:hypothetical protein